MVEGLPSHAQPLGSPRHHVRGRLTKSRKKRLECHPEFKARYMLNNLAESAASLGDVKRREYGARR